MNDYYVYKYSTEKDGVFYIGKGRGERINNPHKQCHYCYSILRRRKEEGIKIIREKIYQGLCEKEAFAWEKFFIDFYKPKANLTDGGEGLSGYRHSKETKRKMSKARTGYKHSEKSKSNMSKARKGKKLPPFIEEHKTKISKALKGRKLPFLSEETKQKIREANLGKEVSEETRRKISKIHKGKEVTRETRQTMSEAQKGKRLTEETKEKIRVALKGNKNALKKQDI